MLLPIISGVLWTVACSKEGPRITVEFDVCLAVAPGSLKTNPEGIGVSAQQYWHKVEAKRCQVLRLPSLWVISVLRRGNCCLPSGLSFSAQANFLDDRTR